MTLSYQWPPVQEVAYSFQFEPIAELHLGHLGLLWGQQFLDCYPFVEQDDPLPHEIERFGLKVIPQKKLPFNFFTSLPVPRLKLYSLDKSTLLQVQNDRFGFNWRKVSGAKTSYPRYDVLKKKFSSELNKFESFLNERSLPKFSFNQITLTNVNHIPVDNKLLSDVFRGFTCNEGMHPDLKEEGFAVVLKQLILQDAQPIGRLYINIQKTNLVADGSEVFSLELTARARPKNETKESAFETLDLMREHINLSFSNLISESMQKSWGREDL